LLGDEFVMWKRLIGLGMCKCNTHLLLAGGKAGWRRRRPRWRGAG
jgi:hypothetical protein